MIEFKFRGLARVLAFFLSPLVKEMERELNKEAYVQKERYTSLDRSVRGLAERSGLYSAINGVLVDKQGKQYPKER